MLQAHDKGTKLIDEDGLFSLVAAAPEAAPAAAPASGVAKATPESRPIAAGSFYGVGKAPGANSDQARKAALASSSLAASGRPLLCFNLHGYRQAAGIDSRPWAWVCMGADMADIGGFIVVHVCVRMEAASVAMFCSKYAWTQQ